MNIRAHGCLSALSKAAAEPARSTAAATLEPILHQVPDLDHECLPASLEINAKVLPRVSAYMSSRDQSYNARCK